MTDFYSPPAGRNPIAMSLENRARRDPRATMASADFAEDSTPSARRSGGDHSRKLLIEACLELMATDAIVAIQTWEPPA